MPKIRFLQNPAFITVFSPPIRRRTQIQAHSIHYIRPMNGGVQCLITVKPNPDSDLKTLITLERVNFSSKKRPVSKHNSQDITSLIPSHFRWKDLSLSTMNVTSFREATPLPALGHFSSFQLELFHLADSESRFSFYSSQQSLTAIVYNSHLQQLMSQQS